MICNSTPIIHFAKIGKLDILKKLFKKLYITDVVKNEILVSGNEEFNDIKKSIDDGWIKILNPKKELDLKLDKGERSVLSLAFERKDKILLDDKKATLIARSLNIDYLRSTTSIIMALKRKLINKKEAKNLVNDLVSTGYYLSPWVYTKIIEIIEK